MRDRRSVPIATSTPCRSGSGARRAGTGSFAERRTNNFCTGRRTPVHCTRTAAMRNAATLLREEQEPPLLLLGFV
jgi:hypothetical protein